MDYTIGSTATYIVDYEFDHVCEIPMAAAVEWVKSACPDADMSSRVKAAELTIGESNNTDADENGWLNKLFVIVGYGSSGAAIALYNHDGKFFVRSKKFMGD